MLHNITSILPQIIVGDRPLEQVCCLTSSLFCQLLNSTNIAFGTVSWVKEFIEAMELVAIHAASIVELDIGLLNGCLHNTWLTTLECDFISIEVNRLVFSFLLYDLHLYVSNLNNSVTMLQQNAHDRRTPYSSIFLCIREHFRSQYTSTKGCKISLVSIVSTNLIVLHQLILEAHA